MKEETVRRTFNINNFESLVIEGVGRDNNPRKSFLSAELDCLNKAQASMIRIFNNRKQHQLSNEFDINAYSAVTTEISWVEQEILNCDV